MARHEEDKEDLITDGTALVHRAEFFCEGAPWQVVTVGYRSNGFLSVYLDQDPFYQFDAQGRLRRALKNSLLYRGQGRTLVELNRDRSQQDRTVLIRRDLMPNEQKQFLNDMKTDIASLYSRLNEKQLRAGRRVTDDLAFDHRLTESLQQIMNLPAAEALSDAINAR